MNLILHVEQYPNKSAQNNLSQICHEKLPSILYERDTMSWLQWKIMWGHISQYLLESAE